MGQRTARSDTICPQSLHLISAITHLSVLPFNALTGCIILYFLQIIGSTRDDTAQRTSHKCNKKPYCARDGRANNNHDYCPKRERHPRTLEISIQSNTDGDEATKYTQRADNRANDCMDSSAQFYYALIFETILPGKEIISARTTAFRTIRQRITIQMSTFITLY